MPATSRQLATAVELIGLTLAHSGMTIPVMKARRGAIKVLSVLLVTTAILAMGTFSANADVIIDTHASGTGDNVVFDSFTAGSNLAIGSFNGQHQGFAFFTDLSGNAGFAGAANGQDIKIVNTSNLDIKVFGPDKTTLLYTATDVFSIVGSGTLTITAQATDGPFVFTEPLGNGQNFFTLTAINGEVISDVDLQVSGVITDFEHYRIDVAAPTPVPVPSTASLFFTGLAGLGLLLRKQRKAMSEA